MNPSLSSFIFDKYGISPAENIRKNHLYQIKEAGSGAEATYAQKTQPAAEISLKSSQERKWLFSGQHGFGRKIQSGKGSRS